MERIDRLVRTWIASEQEQEIEDTVSEIAQGNATLLHIVKSLGDFLTSEEDDLRTKGVEFLSLVLSRCPHEKLNRQSVRTLVTFYCGKLEDTETIIPALKGLNTLSKLPLFASSDAVEVANALFQHVKMRVLVHSQRFVVYSIIDNLVAHHREAMKNMGDEFLRGYIGLAEGEKDPRNLMMAFAIDKVLLIEFDSAKYIEDFFGITFCYFPITFRPPPNDPYGITTEDLRSALRSCLHATSLFGKLAVPLFLEKLNAGSPATKKDTLDTLDVCLPVYGAGVAREFARKLWNALKLEIFQPTDPVTEEKALKTFQVLIQTIYAASPEDKGTENEIVGLAKDACDECMEILREPEKSQAKHAIKVLCAFMSTTPSVSRYTLARAVPHFVKLFLNPDELPNRAPTLRLLADLIEAARQSMSQDPEVLPDDGNVPLLPYKDEVLGILTVGLKMPASAYPAIDALKSMVLTPGLLTHEELGFIVHNVDEVLQKDEEESDLSDVSLDLLSTISSFAPSHVSGNTLPMLFTALPDRAPPRDAEAERVKYWRTLAALRKLCTQPDLFETLVVRFSTKLDLICVPSSPIAEGEDREPSAAYAHSILKTLADVLSIKIEKGHTDVVKYVDRLVPRLYNLFIYSALASEERPMVAPDPRLLAVAAQIITLVTQSLNASRQETFVKAVFAAYLEGDVSHLVDGVQKIPADKTFRPFEPSAPTSQRNLLVLLSAAVVPLYKEVTLPVPDETKFLDNLLQWIPVHAENAPQREALIHLIAAVVNRHADKLDDFLTSNVHVFWLSHIADSSVSSDSRKNAIVVFKWITKALLVRGYVDATKNVDRLLELFDDECVSWDAARAIGRIPGTDKVLTKRNHAVIKILYAQKYTNSVLPRIIEGAKTSQSSRQNAYLVALAALIKSVPKSTYADQMPSLMPLLLRGLELPDNEIRAGVIETLQAAATSDDKENNIVTEHAASLVSTMLKNSLVSQMPSVKVRVAALRYLATLPSVVRYDVLHPQKATVIRELAKALDDPKRAVRREAVTARFKFTG
ncbi:ARM repeat-containing protein [Dichomitus squalens LYAD-421 SS1]|uniref:MMS19 nucleotide excision repair protein n=1 Tax=Dichomitus squalens (strain LYAD-421) TaxID=732165 RepID=R7SS60_DICSQ|nr:ARM repeat-containing protein [Dichomitus squalens LYAD-421 SS1]EJF59029.1 ARM repeat-containing protein [Dichomitus squalens LYAD-421 SS1]